MSDAPRRESAMLYSDLSDDADMRELIAMFVSELPQRVAAMREAIVAGDVAAAQRGAHQLKGAAGGYGFMSITEAAADAEARLRAGEQGEGLKQALEHLYTLCERATALPRPA